ncbi:nitrate/nitrite transporter NrtS [Exilibacterium tricleocarpae]|nr:nitrate/nitrite transporter NrtS [Exilibacterium tricleocarpae]
MQRSGIYLSALKVAVLVGTLLAAINYGDRLVAGTMGSGDWIRLLLT